MMENCKQKRKGAVGRCCQLVLRCGRVVGKGREKR